MQSKILKLRVLTVSLRLKFKCKLRVQSTEGASTQEATSINGLYTIEEELHIYSTRNNIELSLMLISDKGSQYNGGVIRTTLQQLKHSQGSPLKLPISKCIDKEAWMEVKALSVPELEEKSSQRELSFTQQRADHFMMDSLYTPEKNKKGNLVIESNLGETRSEHCFPQAISNFNLTQQRKKQYDTGRPMFGQFSNVRMKKMIEERPLSPFQSSPRRDSPGEQANQQEVTRARKEADLSAGKLKKMQEKYKQEQEKVSMEREKRKNVEFSQHNYKIELVKLSISKEEKEKDLNKKQSRIRQLEGELNKSRQNMKKIAQMKEELKTRTNQNNSLKEQIQTCKAQILKQRSQLQTQRADFDARIVKVQKESMKLAQERQQAIDQLTKKLKAKDDEINNLTNKLNKIQEQNERDKKLKFSNDIKTNQTKNQFQKIITYLKKELKNTKEEYALASSKTEKQRAQSQKQLSSLREQCQRLRVASSRLSIERRSLQEQVGTYEQNLAQLKRYRDKYNQQSSKFKSTKDQLTRLKRKHDSVQQNNHKLEERLKHTYQAMEQYNKNYQIKEFKCNELEEKVRKLEDDISQHNLTLQKQKRIEDTLQKECSNLRQKQKQLKSHLSRKEVQFTKLKLQLQNINEKLTHTRQTGKVDQSAKMFSTYHHDDWEDSRLNNMMQNQKYLQMEIINHKHTISQLQNQLSRYKEEIQKYSKLQYEWRDLERSWQTERIKLSTENAKFARQVKDLTKRIAEQDAKNLVLNERVQKQKKNSKNWQERVVATEAALKKAHDQKQQVSSQLQIKETRLKMIENEVVLLRGQVQLRQTQGKKLKASNEGLELQNRKLREEVGDLSFRIKQQQQFSASQNKKAREQMARYESRLVSYKRQSEKFKDNLRNILVESIISQLSKEQQESEPITKKKQSKLGLTLTNELLIKLEDYLKEMSRHKTQTQQRLRTTQKDLIAIRQESILKTNQFQNTEAQLKIKLDELIDNLNKMKEIYQSREEDLRKSLSENQWQLALKDNEIERLNQALKEAKQNYENEAVMVNQNWTKTQKTLNAQLERLRVKGKDQLEKEASYIDQISSLEDYITALQEKTVNYRNRQCQLQQRLDKMGKEIDEYKQAVSNLTQIIQQSNKQKSQLKHNISVFESQIQESKIISNQYKSQLEILEKEKSEGTTLIRSIMKEKQTMLHQYLASEQKVFELQTKMFQLQEKINEMTNQQESNTKITDQLKDQKKKYINDLKSLQSNLAKRQSEVKEFQEKLKEKQKTVAKLNQQNLLLQTSFSQLKLKSETTVKNLQGMLAQANQTTQLKANDLKSYSTRNQSLSLKNDSLQQQLRKIKQMMQQMKFSLQQVNQRLSESLQVNEKMEVQLFAAKSQLTQLRDELAKARQEIEEKDLKNYMLSSDHYTYQEESANQIDQLESKIATQEEAMLKYEQICQDYVTEIDLLKKSKESMAITQAETEAQLYRITFKHKQTEEELQRTQQRIKDLQSSLQKAHSRRNSEDCRNQEAMLELQEKLNKKDSEVQRAKHENDLLHEMLKKLEENCKNNEHEYQQLLIRCASEAEAGKKYELQLRKIREDLKQLKWSNQRELKKLLQAKVRSLNQNQTNLGEDQSHISQHFRTLQQSLLQILKSYEVL